MFKFTQFFMLAFLVSACGNSTATTNKTSENLELPKTSPQEIEDNNDEVTDTEAIIDSIKIKKSSHNLAWTENYSRALFQIWAHEKVSPLFETIIFQEDLNRLGCSNYNTLSLINKKIFMTVYMAAIAEAESDFRASIVTTNPGDQTSNVGLLQVDVDAANAHTKKLLGNLVENDLLDPETNLQVGAFILKNQIRGKIANARLLPVKSYYWQVLTHPTRLLKNLKNNRQSISFCQT